MSSSMAATLPVIETRTVVKSYRIGTTDVPVLRDISFQVAPGEYVAIMGQSGAGKSTLLNILGCLDVPSGGEYLFRGHPLAELRESQLCMVRNHEIGFVFQNFNLLPKLSVEANVELPLVYLNVRRRERRRMVQAILERLGIWERRHHLPSEISGGQKQRAAIARALVKRPALILADEPTGNLDSTTALEILELFDEMHEEGNTIVLITHEREVALRAQRTIRIVDGRILDQGLAAS
jgi:putative ABC transport system ATP-binding protein